MLGEVARIVYHPLITKLIHRLPELLQADIDESFRYLAEHGRAAQLPDVRHRIAGDPNLTETRNQATIDHRRYTIRSLIVFHTDDLLVATVIGDKDQWPAERGDWYDTWVPTAHQVYELMKGQL